MSGNKNNLSHHMTNEVYLRKLDKLEFNHCLGALGFLEQVCVNYSLLYTFDFLYFFIVMKSYTIIAIFLNIAVSSFIFVAMRQGLWISI